MSPLIDILGGLMLAGACGWVLARPPNESTDKRRCLSVEVEELILGILCVGGTLLFLAAKHI